ncbi:MAG: DUF512 domain-containing protein, partial [Candidatus Marinimicrobia bacterium]|nr:DUF512 domain-containing protein [Candidatus Neomarinimicrobiota bacterium]
SADAVDLKTEDQLVSINGHKISDEIDYTFYSADEDLVLSILRDEKPFELKVEKGLDEELGIEVEPMTMRSCANNCVFCFAHQNPPGVRDALNFKDGDFRFSFLHGHYITMTNMGRKQLERVVEQQLSPLYISVHVTDPDVRKDMLLYGKDDNILEKLEYLTSNNIKLHSQIVLCPGWNDGDILVQTLKDLVAFAPNLLSVSIVPVGLTKYRDNLPKMVSYDKASAKAFIHWFGTRESEFQVDGIERFVYLSDEFFILSGGPIPGNDYYGEFSMIENGVGQCRDFVNRFQASLPMLPDRLKKPVRLLFPTGTLASDLLKKTLNEPLARIENLEYEILPVRNEWLGADLVTVTGLLSARDVVTQIKSAKDIDAIYLSYRMFSEDGVTLDDHTREDIEKKLGVPIYIHHEDMAEILKPWA